MEGSCKTFSPKVGRLPITLTLSLFIILCHSIVMGGETIRSSWFECTSKLNERFDGTILNQNIPVPVGVDSSVSADAEEIVLRLPASADTFVDSRWGSYADPRGRMEWRKTNFGRFDTLSVVRGRLIPFPYNWRGSLIRFQIPEGLEVKSAKFFLKHSNTYGEEIAAYRLSRPWEEYEATWWSPRAGETWAGGWNPGANYAGTPTAVTWVGNKKEWFSWDVSEDVKKFAEGNLENHGWLLQSYARYGSDSTSCNFRSKEFSNETERPYLEIVARPIPTATGVKLNEIRPWSGDTGVGPSQPAFVELYNAGDSDQNLSGWKLAGATDSQTIDLPDWSMPVGSYVVVYLGTGTNDPDFSDGVASYYAGEIWEYNRAAGEVGLYTGLPSAQTLTDFVAWGQGTSTFGMAHQHAIAAGQWPNGAFVDNTNHSSFAHLARIPSGLDRNITGDWHELEQPYVTPYTLHNPIQLSPRDGSLQATLSALTWMAIQNVSSYLVVVDDNPDFSSPVINQQVAGTTYAGDLPDGLYFWQVIPDVAGGPYPAAVWSFSIISSLPDLTPEPIRGSSSPSSGIRAAPALEIAFSLVPQRFQHKDSKLLCIWDRRNATRPGCTEQAGAQGPWDGPHPEGDHIKTCPHCSHYCTRASIQMVNHRFGGTLSQDEISHQLRHLDLKDSNGQEVPEGDLGHGLGAWPQENDAYSWALKGAQISEFSLTPNAPIPWNTLKDEIDADNPVITVIRPPGWFHTVVFTGYAQADFPLGVQVRFIHITDPWPGGTGWYDHSRMPCVRYYTLPDTLMVFGRDTQIDGSPDFDEDGLLDFDEEYRFLTLGWWHDSDDDGITDKAEVRSYTFHDSDHAGHENNALDFPDIDGDGLRAELDDDTDDDRALDGQEDMNLNGIYEAGETCVYNPDVVW